MVSSSTTIGGSTVFADVLDTPVAELAVSDNIDARQDFVDTGSLGLHVRR